MCSLTQYLTWAMFVPLATLTSGFHIDIEYGNFEELTCYTCPAKRNNNDCNSWAPNIPCPLKHTVCKTVHHIDRATGISVHVDKMCSLPEHCTSEHVGCKDTEIGGNIECVSCCTISFCNVAVPYNSTTSQNLSTSLTGSTASHVDRIRLSLAAAALIMLVVVGAV